MRFLVILIAATASLSAQLTRGFLSGTVTDSSGAVVPNVKITIAERSTGIRHVSLTNEAGVYRFVALESGAYSIVFERDGFESARHEGIELSTAQEVVLNPVLAVAASATTVSVETAVAGAQLSKATPTVERTIGQDLLESLPFAGLREVGDIAILSPGVAHVSSDVTQVTYTANGQRAGGNIVTLNGMDDKDPQYQFVTIRTRPEGTAEVQVRTNSFSAEYGRGLGAQVSIVTRSGTNRLHAEAYDYYGANWMSAATFANKTAGLQDVRFSDHQAGGTIGGPLRKDRTFFFFLLSSDRHREGTSANGIGSMTIPTPTGYAALGNVRLADGQTPQSRQAVLSSISFLPEIHAQARRYDNFRNVTVNGANIEFGTTRIGQSRPWSDWNAQLRLDHRLSEKDSLTYFFNEGTHDAPVAVGWPFSNNLFGNRFASSEYGGSQQHALSHIRVFTPALVNEVRLSTSRHIDEVIARDASVPRTAITQFFTMGPAGASPFVRPRNTYEAQNVLTWTRGRHSLKFGGHVLIVEDTISGPQQSMWTFNNFANFFNNQADTLTVRLGDVVQRILSTRQNYFVQDDWKLRPDLTVNLGVRYQLANVPEGLLGAATPQIAAAGVPGPVRPDRNDAAPRFGFAYSPRIMNGWKKRLLGDSATVVRGGYGIGYGLVYEGEAGASLLQLANNYPWNDTRTLDRGRLINAFPVAPTIGQGSGFNPLANFMNYPENAKNPTTHFYSVSLQRQFLQNYIFEIGYLGSRSYHLYAVSEHNPAILSPEQAQKVIAAGTTSNIIPDRQQRSLHPEWGLRTFLDTSAYSNYNAGYVKFDRRFSRGLLIGANYTWSATLGVGENDIRVQNKDNYRTDYARSAIDVPHRFVIHYLWQTPGRRIYSGWRISGVSQWQSGRPFSILTGVDSNGDGGAGSDRPDYNPAGKLSLDPVTGDWRTFVTPIDGTGIVVTPLGSNRLPLQWSMPNGGNLGRHTFRAPAFSLWNLSVMKQFHIVERAQLEFRANATNLFNHRNFGAPVASMNSVNFGRNNSTPASRVVLLGLKLRF